MKADDYLQQSTQIRNLPKCGLLQHGQGQVDIMSTLEGNMIL
jgi:hypothetical protein